MIHGAPGTRGGLLNLVWEWGDLNVAFVATHAFKHCPGIQINLERATHSIHS